MKDGGENNHSTSRILAEILLEIVEGPNTCLFKTTAIDHSAIRAVR
jgi:hypothetical protein